MTDVSSPDEGKMFAMSLEWCEQADATDFRTAIGATVNLLEYVASRVPPESRAIVSLMIRDAVDGIDASWSS